MQWVVLFYEIFSKKMSENAVLITKEGHQKLLDEMNYLSQVERPAVVKAISDARELGDLSENAEYAAAKEKQRVIDSKMSSLRKMESSCKIIDISKIANKNIIHFGATVEYFNITKNIENKITLVSEYESNPSKNLISVSTPIGKALLGKEIGDVAEVIMENGHMELEITKISYEI